MPPPGFGPKIGTRRLSLPSARARASTPLALPKYPSFRHPVSYTSAARARRQEKGRGRGQGDPGFRAVLDPRGQAGRRDLAARARRGAAPHRPAAAAPHARPEEAPSPVWPLECVPRAYRCRRLPSLLGRVHTSRCRHPCFPRAAASPRGRARRPTSRVPQSDKASRLSRSRHACRTSEQSIP